MFCRETLCSLCNNMNSCQWKLPDHKSEFNVTFPHKHYSMMCLDAPNVLKSFSWSLVIFPVCVCARTLFKVKLTTFYLACPQYLCTCLGLIDRCGFFLWSLVSYCWIQAPCNWMHRERERKTGLIHCGSVSREHFKALHVAWKKKENPVIWFLKMKCADVKL